MKSLQSLLTSSFTGTLGWTLLHSLWQGLVIFLIVIFLLRLIPSKKSQLRYTISCIGMLLILISSIVTFSYVDSHQVINEVKNFQFISSDKPAVSNQAPSNASYLHQIKIVLDANISLITSLWIIGLFVFSFRIISGWIYLKKITTQSIPIDNEYHDYLQEITCRLNIGRYVSLAESAQIYAPIVVGYLKPIILVPVGMFSGLTTQQIETIFIHELAHIKRHDFVVNIMQYLAEAIFFFNPFVWILSNIIRREREFCCDDAVIAHQGNPLAYAYALTQLEEARLSKTMFAVALAENKNQLLNRIKRIMEKSVKNYSMKDRLVPVVLLVVGLMCASWLTLKSKNDYQHEKKANTFAADTSIKKKSNVTRYSRKSVTRTGEDGQPYEEVTEEFEGDESLRPMFESMDIDVPVDVDMPMAFDFPVPPAPVFPGMPSVDMFGPMAPMQFQIDSLPAFAWTDNSEDWETFSKEFETEFKENFGDFYKSHQQDFEKMMKAMEEKFRNRFEGDDWNRVREGMEINAEQMRAHEEAMRRHHEGLRHHEEGLRRHEEEMDGFNSHHERALQELDKNMEDLDAAMSEHEAHLDAMMTEMDANMEVFEKELKQELVKDGYISKNEKIDSFQFDEEGGMKINGKTIKEKDNKRYKDLHAKYFKHHDKKAKDKSHKEKYKKDKQKDKFKYGKAE